MDNWLTTSAAELGRGIEAGGIDPRYLTETYLDAIGAHPHAERIYARLTAERARAEAGAAAERAKRGLRRSPLDGVPISWKDLFDTAGVATEAGSALLAGRVPGQDAEVLRNATAAGLICLGKTHMTELAFSGLGVNPVTATPPNVHDPALAPGGSSSGAATSVAFGLAAAGIGSDTGGSVRVPSVWNDLVGLKTGAGRLPLKGVVPLCPRFDTVGPLCRTVEDAALLLAALEGGKPADLAGAGLKGTRFMVLETVAQDDLREGPRAGFEQALDRLEAAGAALVRAEAPEVAEAMPLSAVLYAAEAYGTWRDVIEAAPDKMYSEVLKRFRGGRDVSGADYVAGWQKLDRLRAAWTARIAEFDAVLLPTCPILPPDVERLLSDADFFVSENLLTLRNTRIGNLMGSAVLTLPTGVPATGLSLMGPPMSEERLLRLGAAVEMALA
jgi:aspartyl-tRNA(Asn)/glutamyl-tRNA(Gln) amidotransferase subunit A